MIGDEKRVVNAFCDWLIQNGWTISREKDFVDVVAYRGDEKLYAEAKGRTKAIGLDIDTLYGQLLRHMPNRSDTRVRFAVVVPTEARNSALRVPPNIRKLLQIDVFVVDEQGLVKQIVNE